MHEHLVALEERMQQLQHAIRQALTQHDHVRAGALRVELKRTQLAWDVLCGPDDAPDNAPSEPSAPAAPEHSWEGRPARDQVREVLTLLTVPASPRLLSQVHQAFFSGPLNTARLTTLRRDEERSFRSTPYARPYYVCSALTSDLLSPARALLALSTWPLEQRIVGPLTQRVHFLTSALRLVDAAKDFVGDAEPPQPIQQLLQPYSRNLHTNTNTSRRPLDLDAMRQAAATELEIHADDDADTRAEAARRAREQLGDVEQHFGSILRDANRQRRTS